MSRSWGLPDTPYAPHWGLGFQHGSRAAQLVGFQSHGPLGCPTMGLNRHSPNRHRPRNPIPINPERTSVTYIGRPAHMNHLAICHPEDDIPIRLRYVARAKEVAECIS